MDLPALHLRHDELRERCPPHPPTNMLMVHHRNSSRKGATSRRFPSHSNHRASTYGKSSHMPQCRRWTRWWRLQSLQHMGHAFAHSPGGEGILERRSGLLHLLGHLLRHRPRNHAPQHVTNHNASHLANSISQVRSLS